MPSVSLTVEDLKVFAPDIDEAKAAEMITTALARAAWVAPCILDGEFEHDEVAKGIIRDAILRWNEAGTGALSSEQVQTGPYGHTTTFDTRQPRRPLFWPSEVSELQKLCSESTGAFSVDTMPAGNLVHDDICALNFGAVYCSCGVVLTGTVPLYRSN